VEEGQESKGAEVGGTQQGRANHQKRVPRFEQGIIATRTRKRLRGRNKLELLQLFLKKKLKVEST